VQTVFDRHSQIKDALHVFIIARHSVLEMLKIFLLNVAILLMARQKSICLIFFLKQCMKPLPALFQTHNCLKLNNFPVASIGDFAMKLK